VSVFFFDTVLEATDMGSDMANAELPYGFMLKRDGVSVCPPFSRHAANSSFFDMFFYEACSQRSRERQQEMVFTS
jgi:hypothetical protein